MDVTYTSLSGIEVTLTPERVVALASGQAAANLEKKEILNFMRTCQAKKLDPYEAGEVFLIKTYPDKPAQIVVGISAYIRRADNCHDYRGHECGITVTRPTANGIEVIQKKGACVYSVIGEELIGGWCKVFRDRGNGVIDETFREVALAEYSSGKNNWGSKPATMIQKVAQSQAFRAAFPSLYEGLYTVEEMQASGVIGTEAANTPTEARPTTTETTVATVDKPISKDEQNQLFELAKELPGGNQQALQIVQSFGFKTSTKITAEKYPLILDAIKEAIMTDNADLPPDEAE